MAEVHTRIYFLLEAYELFIENVNDEFKRILQESEENGEYLKLQDYVASNCKVDWMTAIGIIDSVDLLVKEATSNVNIKVDENS